MELIVFASLPEDVLLRRLPRVNRLATRGDGRYLSASDADILSRPGGRLTPLEFR